MKQINFRKIAANASAVFISTFAGIVTANGLIRLDIALKEILILAVFPALIQAAMAFCNEWHKAEEQLEADTTGSIQNVTNTLKKTAKKLSLSDFLLTD